MPFILSHIAVLGAFWSGITWQAVVLAVVLCAVRMFGVTAGYHRCFAHRTFKTGRVFRFVLAFLAESSSQKGVLWWAAHRREHHKHSDTDRDVHSPVKRGFLSSHVGWIFDAATYETRPSKVRDPARASNAYIMPRTLRLRGALDALPPCSMPSPPPTGRAW
jgi:stearoyl-CoA desaturase (delta-9 desaturase)